MSEETQAPTTTETAPSTAGQPESGQSPQPSGGQQTQNQQTSQQPQQTQDSPDIKRYVDQINGMKPFIEPLRKHGINDPGAIEQAIADAQKYRQLSQKGIQVDQLLGSVEQETQRQQGENYLTEDSLSQVLDRREAIATHKSAHEQMKQGIQSIQRELGGEDGASLIEHEVNAAIRQYANEHGQRYPAIHPLHDTNAMQPLTQSDMEKVKQIAQGIIDQKRGFYTRQQATSTQTQQTGMKPGQTMQGATDTQGMTATQRLDALQAQARERARSVAGDQQR